MSRHDVRRIVIDGGWGRLSSLDLYTAVYQVLADDEELSSVDYAASDTIDQFALFTVIGNSHQRSTAGPGRTAGCCDTSRCCG